VALDPLALRPLGRTGLQVTALCVGGSPLGNMSALYGYEVSTERALRTLRAVLAGRSTSWTPRTTTATARERAAHRRRAA
jgi:hypothetical protein